MGYEIKRFESVVDDELICAICEGVLENPTQVIICEHIFCWSCLDKWFTKGKLICPLDRQVVNKDDMKTPRIVTNLLAKLNIKCDFELYGCGAVVKLESLAQHCSHCDYNPQVQSLCSMGCGLTLARNEINKHNCMSDLHQLVRTQCRQITELQKHIDGITKQFDDIKLSNERFTELFKQMRSQITKLEVQCKDDHKQSVQFKHFIVKCSQQLNHIIDDSNSTECISIQFNENRVDVNPCQLISDIKYNIRKSFDIKSGKLRLYYGSKELEDSNTLVHYGIDHTSHAKLSLTISDEVQIFVKIRVMNSKDNVKHPFLFSDLLPKTIALHVDRNETIAQLKANVRLIHNIDIENVLLTYGTQTLEDHNTITHYDITDGSFINYYAHL